MTEFAEMIAEMTIKKTTTDCCAFCQLSKVNDRTPIRAIQIKLERLKKEMDANTEVGITTGNGQTAVFSVVSPGENILMANLLELGFKEAWTFPRRRGYPQTGDLKLMIKNL